MIQELQAGCRGAESVADDLRRTFRTGTTRKYEWRIDQLRKVVTLVQQHKAEIGEALLKDMGKDPYETYACEVSPVVRSCEDAIKNLKNWMAPQKVAATLFPYPSKCELLAEPLGITLILSAWNFPFLLAADPLVGTVAAGNAAVVKPSELAPTLSALLARLIPLYLDNAAIRVVEGSLAATTALLQQKWDKIFYTGSPTFGKIVMTEAAKQLTPVMLELNGKCPILIDSTADLKLAARRIVAGKWGMKNGQACVAPDYVLTPGSVALKLVNFLKDVLRQFFGADPSVSPDVCHIVSFSHFVRLTRLLDDPKTSDKIVHGGNRDEKSLYIAPTILLNPPLDSAVMTEEIFGPLLPIISVDRVEEALDVVSSMPKPLVAYIFTSSMSFQEEVAANLSSSGIVVNDACLHVQSGLSVHFQDSFPPPRSSFLTGFSGENGRAWQHGKFSFDTFSHRKAVLYRSFKYDFLARYPPFTKAKQEFLKCLLSGDMVGVVVSLLGWLRSTWVSSLLQQFVGGLYRTRQKN